MNGKSGLLTKPRPGIHHIGALAPPGIGMANTKFSVDWLSEPRYCVRLQPQSYLGNPKVTASSILFMAKLYSAL